MTKYSFTELQALWKDAGGSAVASVMAAAVAMAESGGNSDAVATNTNGTVDRGLWQINSIHGSQSVLDPVQNARAAVAISKNGTNWRPWCTCWSNGRCGGTFLGVGSPVLKFLGSDSTNTGTETTPVSNTLVGLGDTLNPQEWAKAFLQPIGVWMWYGVMLMMGILMCLWATMVLVALMIGKSKAGQMVADVGLSYLTRKPAASKGGSAVPAGAPRTTSAAVKPKTPYRTSVRRPETRRKELPSGRTIEGELTS